MISSLSRRQYWHVAIDDERARQERLKREGKFKYTLADPELSDGERLAILAEEFGEVARAVLEKSKLVYDSHSSDLIKELVQVAAICVAWLEHEGKGY